MHPLNLNESAKSKTHKESSARYFYNPIIGQLQKHAVISFIWLHVVTAPRLLKNLRMQEGPIQIT